jgi:hypothetical protein
MCSLGSDIMTVAVPTDVHISNPGMCSLCSGITTVPAPSGMTAPISANHHYQGMSVKKCSQLHQLRNMPFWWCTVSSVSYQEELHTTSRYHNNTGSQHWTFMSCFDLFFKDFFNVLSISRIIRVYGSLFFVAHQCLKTAPTYLSPTGT